MKRSVTEELVKILKDKKTDFILLSALPADFIKRLELAKKPKVTLIAEKLSPHLGNDLAIKDVARSKYLAFKLPDEILLCRTVQKHNGKIPRMDRVPFKKDEFFSILNQMLEQGTIRHKYVKNKKGYEPILVEGAPPPLSPPLPPTEKMFEEAYFELERGKFYVRICDLRQHLGWTVQEFDKILTGLRDSGKIQLQGGDIDYFTKDDISASFIDENGTLKLTVMWR